MKRRREIKRDGKNQSARRALVLVIVLLCLVPLAWLVLIDEKDPVLSVQEFSETLTGNGTSPKQVIEPPRLQKAFLRQYITAPTKKTHNANTSKKARSFEVKTLAEGLHSPDGLTTHPATGLIYFSEETAQRISLIRGNHIQIVISADTPVYSTYDGKRTKCPGLRSPEGISFGPNGGLYVAEDYPGGRILRFSPDGDGFSEGIVIPIAGTWARFAWEGIDVSHNGELLIAGSDVEGALDSSTLTPFSGVILFRDKESQWWICHERLFASYSSVCFTPDARQATYTCEISGEVGWIDLTTRESLSGHSELTAQSPEGLSFLPDGTILIAEEKGAVVNIDPSSDKHNELLSGLGTIESVVWDSLNGRVLVSADGSGKILALMPSRPYSDERNAMEYAPYHSRYAPRHVPVECPPYLADVLARGGLDYDADTQAKVTFREFASRVPLIAADAKASPVAGTSNITDPIEQIQFAIFEPNQLLIAEGGQPSLALAVFAVRRRSGKITSTSQMRAAAYISSFETGQMEPADIAKLTIPQAGSVSVSELGIATIQFLGLGRIPDYSLVLNPRNPQDSYMVVFAADGTRQHYRLTSPQHDPKREHWVIAMNNNSQTTEWTLLGAIPENDRNT